MKPPLTVEAKVAEELRNWLASELEQLDASNTNQFAHHVVTILLNEDLDIEDEPLTTGDDFLEDIYAIRCGKTRDKQRKAAVQFLKSAVCCDEPGEAEIQGVVDELMVKIDETKRKMSAKKSSKRSLLAPIAINVEAATTHSCVKSNGSEEERRYNEAFPSLSSDESPSKEGVAKLSISNNTSVWNRSPPDGKENQKRRLKKKSQQNGSKQTHIFNCQEEAQACSVAREVVALVLAEAMVPNAEATEVIPISLHEASPQLGEDDNGSCWKSAFRTVCLTKVFAPTTAPLCPTVPSIDSVSPGPKVFTPTVVKGDGTVTLEEQIHHKNLLAQLPHLFRPIAEKRNKILTSQDMVEDTCKSSEEENSADVEVISIFKLGAERAKKLKEKVKAQKIKELQESCPDIEGMRTFPTHHGRFWEDMIHNGVISLYPDLSCMMGHCKAGGNEGITACVQGSSDVSMFLEDLFLLSSEFQENCKELEEPLIKHCATSIKSPGKTDSYPRTLLCAGIDLLMAMKQKHPVASSDPQQDIDKEFDMLLDFCWGMVESSVVRLRGSDKPSKHQGKHLAKVVNYGSHVPSKLGDKMEDWADNYTDGNCFSFLEELGGKREVAKFVSASEGGFSPSFLDRLDMIDSGNENKRPVGTKHTEKVMAGLMVEEDVPQWLNSCTEGEWYTSCGEWTEDGIGLLSATQPWALHEGDQYQAFTDTVGCNGLQDIREMSIMNCPSSMQTFDLSTLHSDPHEHETFSHHNSHHELEAVQQWEGPWSYTQWDCISHEILANFATGSSSLLPTSETARNPFMPSLLSSCLSSEGAQFLQSAFVNSYFSSNFEDPSVVHSVERHMALDCSELEQQWLNSELQTSWDWGSANSELIQGRTCSNWLENNCKLGLLCPFSHPNI